MPPCSPSLCLFPLCAFCLTLASGVSATFLQRFQTMPFPLPTCLQKRAKKWHSLPLVLFAQPLPFFLTVVSTTCVYGGGVYAHMWWDKSRENPFFTTPVLFLQPPGLFVGVCPPPLVLLPWVVGVQLSTAINAGLVLLAFEADSLLYSVIALFHNCLLLAFCVCVCKCVYRGCCTHLAPAHVSVRGWTWKRKLRLAGWTIMSSFGCNCLTNVGEKGEKMDQHGREGVFWNAKQTQIKLCLVSRLLAWEFYGWIEILYSLCNFAIIL